MADVDADYWTMTDIAEYFGVKLQTVHGYRRRGRQLRKRAADGEPLSAEQLAAGLPQEDNMIGRTPVWRPSTITSWKWPGKGAGGGRPHTGRKRLTADEFFRLAEKGEPLTPEEAAALRKINQDLLKAIAPLTTSLNKNIASVWSPHWEAISKAISVPLIQAAQQLSRAMMPPSLGPLGTQLQVALKGLPPTLVLPGVDPAAALSRDLSAAIGPAYRVFVDTSHAPEAVMPLVDVARAAGEEAVEEAAQNLLAEPRVREALEEVLHDASDDLPDGVPNVGWYIALGLFGAAPIPVTYAVARDSGVHPTIDAALTSIALAVAVIALFLSHKRRS
ncbi:hypothetical protein [Nonomuraea sp. NPDC048826]|uniref:hypothetical protein n=1 Tax=Nonomuraea sp. NPDC048826 TaxID=3364347 RepID=UPI003710C04C